MPETREIVIGVVLVALILFALNDKDAITDKMLAQSPDDDDDAEARKRKAKRDELDERFARVKLEQEDFVGRAQRFLDEAPAKDDPPARQSSQWQQLLKLVGDARDIVDEMIKIQEHYQKFLGEVVTAEQIEEGAFTEQQHALTELEKAWASTLKFAEFHQTNITKQTQNQIGVEVTHITNVIDARRQQAAFVAITDNSSMREVHNRLQQAIVVQADPEGPDDAAHPRITGSGTPLPGAQGLIEDGENAPEDGKSSEVAAAFNSSLNTNPNTSSLQKDIAQAAISAGNTYNRVSQPALPAPGGGAAAARKAAAGGGFGADTGGTKKGKGVRREEHAAQVLKPIRDKPAPIDWVQSATEARQGVAGYTEGGLAEYRARGQVEPQTPLPAIKPPPKGGAQVVPPKVKPQKTKAPIPGGVKATLKAPDRDPKRRKVDPGQTQPMEAEDSPLVGSKENPMVLGDPDPPVLAAVGQPQSQPRRTVQTKPKKVGHQMEGAVVKENQADMDTLSDEYKRISTAIAHERTALERELAKTKRDKVMGIWTAWRSEGASLNSGWKRLLTFYNNFRSARGSTDEFRRLGTKIFAGNLTSSDAATKSWWKQLMKKLKAQVVEEWNWRFAPGTGQWTTQVQGGSEGTSKNDNYQGVRLDVIGMLQRGGFGYDFVGSEQIPRNTLAGMPEGDRKRRAIANQKTNQIWA